MPAYTNQDPWPIIEDYLYSKIQTAIAGTQLAGIANFDRVAPPEADIFPCVGLQFSDYSVEEHGTRTHKVTCRFDIVVAVKQEQDDLKPDTRRAALDQLRKYIDDGSGNGMSPLLRGDATLNSLCSWSLIRSMQRVVLQSDASAASTIASAIYSFEAVTLVRF